MVGPPKSLYDLSKIEAAVQLRCEDCGHTVVRGLQDLIAEVKDEGGTTDWPEFRYALICPKCEHSGAMLRPRVMPFTEGEPRKRGYHGLLINLSLGILHNAAYRPDNVLRATPDVRLALHVLRPFLGDPATLTAFWEKADVPRQHPWESCRPLYVGIAQALIRRGYPVWRKNRP